MIPKGRDPLTLRLLAGHFERVDIRSPLHRFASRTALLEAVPDDLLFNGASLSDLPADLHHVRRRGTLKIPRRAALGRITAARSGQHDRIWRSNLPRRDGQAEEEPFAPPSTSI